MSSTQFYSDALTYLTVSALFGASLAGQIDWSQSANAKTAAEVPGNLVAAVEVDEAEVRTIADRQRVLEAGDAFADIPQAVLIPVTFDRRGVERVETAALSPARPVGVVTGSSVNIRSGPSTQHAVVLTAARGDEFRVTGRTSGDWVEVHDAGATGTAWVHGAYFKANAL